MQERKELKHLHESLSKEILVLLHNEVGHASNKNERNRLLAIARKIRKGKNLTEDNIDNGKLSPLLTKYCDAVDLIRYNYAAIVKVYNKEILFHKNSLKNIASSKVLLGGLCFSSLSFKERVCEYIQKPINTDIIDSDEIGLMKYASRIATKTSPFSTFTNISLSHLSEKQFDFGGDLGQQYSTINLNNFLLDQIKDVSFSDPSIYFFLDVNINPTFIISEDSTAKFLVNRKNEEFFQNIQILPIIELLISILQTNDVGITYSNLVNSLLSLQLVDFQPEHLYKILNYLILSGFLEFSFPVSGLDSRWVEHSLDFFQSIPSSETSLMMIAQLEYLLTQLNKIRKASLSEKDVIILDVHKSLIEYSIYFRNRIKVTMAEVLHEHLPSIQEASKNESNYKYFLSPEKVFYEDTYRESNIQINNASVELLVDSLTKLIESTTIFSSENVEKQRMLQFYKHKYNGVENIALIRFYEDYYREYKNRARKTEQTENDTSLNSSITNSSKSEQDVTFIPDVSQSKLVKEEHLQKLLDCIPQSIREGVIHLSSINLPEPTTNASNNVNSYEAFVQFYDLKSSGCKAVLNSLTPGYGKMLSRFLPILPNKITHLLQKRYSFEYNSKTIFAEALDTSHYNANIHPNIFQHLIIGPGSVAADYEASQLQLSDLTIAIVDGELMLKHTPTDSVVYVQDLSFQISLGRSNLFNLLNIFSKTKWPNFYFFIKNLCARHKQILSDAVTVYPRIMLDNTLVLQRKTWQIRREAFPSFSNINTLHDEFILMNDWRSKYQIPDRVFMKCYSSTAFETNRVNDIIRSYQNSKPQFIDFGNPSLISILKKEVLSKKLIIEFEEMLPASEDYLAVDNDRVAAEFIIHWDY